MRTTIQNLIEQLQKEDQNVLVEYSMYVVPTCPTCGGTEVDSCSGYGWYCKNGCGSWGRD